MQNRLATAILMAMGGALAENQQAKIWSDTETYQYLERVSEIVIELLKGEVIQVKGDYPPMELSGSNIAQQGYNSLAADFLNQTDAASDVKGYQE